MPRESPRLVYIGIKNFVVAVDAATGTEVWRTKLKGSDFVSLHRTAERLLAGNQGEVFCLDPSTGAVLWHNNLKGLGMGIVNFSSMDKASAQSSDYVSTAAQKRIQDQRAAAAAAAG